MADAITISAKYIYLDIVAFTLGRSVEAQSDLVDILNRIVSGAVRQHEVPSENVIFLPTGDGMCVALLGMDDQYDLHLKTALNIILAVDSHNVSCEDEMRRFRVRIGINANVDNLVTDINGNRNLAGAGINMCQRIMSMADAAQILVGTQVFDSLRQREQYMHSFRSYVATVKHGVQMPVHQFVDEGSPGLDCNTPSAFCQSVLTPPKLTKLVAYYWAHAIKHRRSLIGAADKSDGDRACVVTLYFRACDSVDLSERKAIDGSFNPRTMKAESASIDQQFESYRALDYWVLVELSNHVHEHLRPYRRFFEIQRLSFCCIFVSERGERLLKEQWPRIWNEFDLDILATYLK